MVGLSTAMMLARDGHHVTVLERDRSARRPTTRQAAWEAWDRRGVNQFRLLHFLLPAFRQTFDAELPDVVRDLRAAGALSFNPLRDAPAEMTGGYRDGDEELEAVTARRPVAESVVARAAASTTRAHRSPGRRRAGSSPTATSGGAVPHVIGRGHRGRARRSTPTSSSTAVGGARPSPIGWRDAGGRGPIEEIDDCGFVYYGRHFRSADGCYAVRPSGPRSSTTTRSRCSRCRPTTARGVSASSPAREDADAAGAEGQRPRGRRSVTSYPLVAHWLDGEPLDEAVAVMAKIEDRHRRVRASTAPRWRPACSPSATRGRARTRRSAAASRSG